MAFVGPGAGDVATQTLPGPQLNTSYATPMGTSGPMTPAQLALFQQQADGGGGNYMNALQRPTDVPPPAPPAPPNLDFMTPQMQAYVNQFHQSQAAQQQAINSGLLQAMQGLGQRRDAAAGVVASVPGQYNAIMNTAIAQDKGPAAVAGDTPVPTAESGAVGAANDKLIASANRSIGEAGKLGQPLLNAAVAADYSKGATTLNNQHMQNQAALEAQNSAFAEKQMEMQQQWQQMLATFQHEDSQKNSNNPNDLNSLAGQEKLAAFRAALTPDSTTAGANDLAQKAGFQGGNNELQSTLGSKEYQIAVNGLTGSNGYTAGTGPDGTVFPKVGDIAAIVRMNQNNPDVMRALQVQGILQVDQNTHQWIPGPNFTSSNK